MKIFILFSISLLAFTCCTQVETKVSHTVSHHYKLIGNSVPEIINNLSQANFLHQYHSFFEDHEKLKKARSQQLSSKYKKVDEIFKSNNVNVSVTYILQNDKIIAGKLKSTNLTKSYEILDYQYIWDTIGLKEYLFEFNSRFSTDYVLSDICDILEGRFELGLGMGINSKGIVPAYIELIDELQSYNYEYVTDLLKSVIPEAQALGMIGVEEICIQFDKIEDCHIDYFTEIYESQSEISVIYGCS